MKTLTSALALTVVPLAPSFPTHAFAVEPISIIALPMKSE